MKDWFQQASKIAVITKCGRSKIIRSKQRETVNRGPGSTCWGRLCQPEVKELWSLSVRLCDNKWLQPSPSPVRLQ